MQKVVIDTSIIIDYIRAEKGPLLNLLERSQSKKNKVYIPTIVVMELWKGKSMKDGKIEQKINRLIKTFISFPLNKQLSKKAGSLVREEKMYDVADAIIAATALHLNAHLATQNPKHFQSIPGLKLYNPLSH